MSETTNLKLFKHDNPATNENQFDVTKALNNNWDKIDDFAETTNTKITENQNNIKSLQTDNTTNKKDIATLKSDNTTNKQDIANLKTENEELKAENERLNQDLNALPSNTAEGEYITLTDSADSRFNMFKIKGNSIQNGEPTPSNQIKIQNVEGNINITVTNENIVLNGYSTPKTDKVFWGGTSTNFTPLKEGWGRFVLNNQGSSNAYVNAYISIKKFKNIIKPNASYQLLVEFRNVNISSSANANYFCICSNYTNEIFNENIIYNKNNLDNKLKFSEKITTKSNIEDYTYLFRSFLSVSPGSSISLEVRISLLPEKSSQTEIIIDNQEYEFPLSEGQKLYEDSYLAEDGIHHLRKQFVVDGTEKIYSVTLIGKTVKFNLAKNGSVGTYWDKTPIRFCNIYGIEFIKKWSELTDSPESLGVASYTSQLKFGISNDYIGLTSEDDLETRKTKVSNWLKDNNIVVEEVVDEYIEAYTEEKKKSHNKIQNEAKTYKTVTNIFSTNEVSPKFEVNYRRDIDTYIDNKLANVNEQILNIAGGN